MTKEVEFSEREAAATPRDFKEDFRDARCDWNVCSVCHHYFLAIPTRTICRACKELKCSPS